MSVEASGGISAAVTTMSNSVHMATTMMTAIMAAIILMDAVEDGTGDNTQRNSCGNTSATTCFSRCDICHAQTQGKNGCKNRCVEFFHFALPNLRLSHSISGLTAEGHTKEPVKPFNPLTPEQQMNGYVVWAL